MIILIFTPFFPCTTVRVSVGAGEWGRITAAARCRARKPDCLQAVIAVIGSFEIGKFQLFPYLLHPGLGGAGVHQHFFWGQNKQNLFLSALEKARRMWPAEGFSLSLYLEADVKSLLCCVELGAAAGSAAGKPWPAAARIPAPRNVMNGTNELRWFIRESSASTKSLATHLTQLQSTMTDSLAGRF